MPRLTCRRPLNPEWLSAWRQSPGCAWSKFREHFEPENKTVNLDNKLYRYTHDGCDEDESIGRNTLLKRGELPQRFGPAIVIYLVTDGAERVVGKI
jgi:hypothetical protein